MVLRARVLSVGKTKSRFALLVCRFAFGRDERGALFNTILGFFPDLGDRAVCLKQNAGQGQELKQKS